MLIETRAAIDIDQASGWIAAGSPEAAELWFNGIEAAIYSLEHFPKRCPRAREDGLFKYELRQLVYGRGHRRHRIIFTVRDERVHVLHVRHGAFPTMTKDDVKNLLLPLE